MKKLNWEEWSKVLKTISQNLIEEQSIEIIGSGALMQKGMPGRTSEDLDIWLPMSDINIDTLKKACKLANIGLDYDGTYSGENAYIQLINPKDIASIIEHSKDEQEILTNDKLTVKFPSLEVLAVSKLASGRPKDIEDLNFISDQDIDLKKVKSMIQRLKNPLDQETAYDNLVYLEINDFSEKDLKTDKELFLEDLNLIKKQFNKETEAEKKLEILRKTLPMLRIANSKGWIQTKDIKVAKNLILRFLKNEVKENSIENIIK